VDLLFVFEGREVAKRGVQSLAVVEDLMATMPDACTSRRALELSDREGRRHQDPAGQVTSIEADEL
jgi:hypothetical protein